MAKLLFRLNGVPDDEADDVRHLLDHTHIDCYETTAGRWGVSLAAIWVRDEGEYDKARQLIDDYQETRRQQAQSVSEQEHPQTFIERAAERPVDLALVALGVLTILGLTLWPFLTAFE